jgi:hypothetical protein
MSSPQALQSAVKGSYWRIVQMWNVCAGVQVMARRVKDAYGWQCGSEMASIRL